MSNNVSGPQGPDGAPPPLQPHPPVPPSPHRQRTSRRAAIGLTAVYSIVVLTLALAFGMRLNTWARDRIIQSSVLAAIDQPADAAAAVVKATQQAAQPEAAQQAPQAAQQAPAPNVTPTPPPINVLVLGTDGRPDESDAARTDTMILLTLDPTSKSIGMLSLPRDLWVPIPGQNITNKINTAYTLGETSHYPGGGAQLAKDTVSSFIGRPVDYYVRVNFGGFEEIIDLIGGIDINVPYEINDDQYPTADYGVELFHLDAGLQHLDGATALKYARTRHGDDDYSRARRQQDIIRAVAEKVLNAGMIPQLIAKAPQLLMTTQNTIQTDIPIPTALELAKMVNGTSLREVRQLVLDKKYGEETYSSAGMWILLPDRSKVREAVDQFFQAGGVNVASTAGASAANAADSTADNTTGNTAGNTAGVKLASVAGAAANTTLSTVAAASSSPRVEVLNGTTQPGVAAATADLLRSRGWDVVSIGDADRKDYVQTIVINYAAPDAVAQKISSDLNLSPNYSTLKGLNSAAAVDLRIVVGADLLPQLK